MSVAYLIICLGCLAPLSSSQDMIESFKKPGGMSELEIIQNETRTVHLGVYIPLNDTNEYHLLLQFKSSNLRAGVDNNLAHLLSIEERGCISKEEDYRCRQLEVNMRAHPDVDNERISLVVYVLRPWPVVTNLETQEFIIKVVDPPTPSPSPPPSTSPTANCPNLPAPNLPAAQTGIHKTTGNAVLGVLLAAAFLASFIFNFVFMGLWYKAERQKSTLRESRNRPLEITERIVPVSLCHEEKHPRLS